MMSLLEDVFLQDEANEAQELERIIEGDEFNDIPRSDSDDNSEKEGEAEEEKKRIDPSTNKIKRTVKNPRVILNPARLLGPRGIQVIPEHFKNFQFRGKGHEKEDLDMVLKKLEHWAYRLYPKFKFDDCLKKIETLGKKRPVMVHLQKIRSDQYLSEETVVQKDSSDDEYQAEITPPQDEFDKLLQQQIELARSTPISSVKKGLDMAVKERSVIKPKGTCSPSISDEQRERMLKSRKLAEEKRLARLTQSNTSSNTFENDHNNSDNHHPYNAKQSFKSQANKNSNTVNSECEDGNNIGPKRIYSKSNIIDSSDEEDDVVMNESVTVDIHKGLENVSVMDTPDDNGVLERQDDSLTVNNREENEDIEQTLYSNFTLNKNNVKVNSAHLDKIASETEFNTVVMNESVKSKEMANIKDHVRREVDKGLNIDLDDSENAATDNETNMWEKSNRNMKEKSKSENGYTLREIDTTNVECMNETDYSNERSEEKSITKDVEDLMNVDFSDDF